MQRSGFVLDVITYNATINALKAIANASEHGELANTDRIIKATTLMDSLRASDTVSKKTLEINPKLSLTELVMEVVKDRSDMTVKYLIRLSDTYVHTSGSNLGEPTQPADPIHRMIALDLNIEVDDEVANVTNDLPLWRRSRASRTTRPSSMRLRAPLMKRPRWPQQSRKTSSTRARSTTPTVTARSTSGSFKP